MHFAVFVSLSTTLTLQLVPYSLDLFFAMNFLMFFLFYLAPVPVLFVVFNGFAILGVVQPLLRAKRDKASERQES